MLGFAFGLKGMAIAAAVAFVIGSGTGWRMHAKISDAAYYKALTAAYQKAITTLQVRITATNTAAKADQERAAQIESQRAAAEEKANALAALVKDGQCFADADTDGLRKLWAHPARPAAGTARRAR